MIPTLRPYSLSDAELDAIETAMVHAAWTALRPLSLDCSDDRDRVLTCLNAIREAKEALRRARAAILDAHRGHNFVESEPDALVAVCAAMLAGDNLPDASLGYERSGIGLLIGLAVRWVPMLRAAQLLQALSAVHDHFLDDDLSPFGSYLSDEAWLLASRVKRDGWASNERG